MGAGVVGGAAVTGSVDGRSRWLGGVSGWAESVAGRCC